VTRYACILADPPWPARNRGTRMAPDYEGEQRASAWYDVQSVEDICRGGAWVQSIAADDAFLWLWAPNYVVLEGDATRVAEAYGFTPKQLIPWVKTDARAKPRLGGGNYTRVCTEQLLLCTRGRPKPLRRDVPGIVVAERSKHSAKPDASYRLIEKLCAGPRIELYARRRFSAEWDAYGNQLAG
jgi:N6-adenosine-specific RNA methylase IME4